MYKGQPGKQDTTRISEEYEEPLICSPQQTQGKQIVALGSIYHNLVSNYCAICMFLGRHTELMSSSAMPEEEASPAPSKKNR